MPTRPVVTLHAPMAKAVADELLTPIIELVERYGFKWWLSTENLPDLVLFIDTPKEWLRRGATQAELDHFEKLYESGQVEEAHRFIRVGGFPAYMR